MGYSLSFEVESVTIARSINSGNGNIADRDLISFSILNGADQPTVIRDATLLGDAISDGTTIQLKPGDYDSGGFQVSSGIPLSAIVIIGCDEAGTLADATARHNKALAQSMDAGSAEWGVTGAALGALGGLEGPAGVVALAAGVICAAVAAVLQLVKDCIGDGPTPKSGVVFSSGLTYTLEEIQTHAVDGADNIGRFWRTTVPYKNNAGSDCSVTFKVYVFYEQDPVFPPNGPGKMSARIGGAPSEWTGVWGDNGNLENAKIVCEIDQGVGPAPQGMGARMWLYLSSSEATYRVAMAPSAFQLGGKRPARQFSLDAFVPANPEALSGMAGSLSLREGSAPSKTDLYTGKEDSPWSVPMQVTKYNGPIYPGPKGTGGATTFAPTAPSAPLRAAVSAPILNQAPVTVGPNPTQVGPNPAQVRPNPPPVGAGPKAPAVEFADTICLPGNVFLQLYIVYNIAAPAKRWANRVRYLRLDNKGGTITDVLLDHTSLQPF